METRDNAPYLEPEPILHDPQYLSFRAQKDGRSMPVYSYAANNPVKESDPSGKYPDLVCAYDLYSRMNNTMRHMNCRNQDKWFYCVTSCLIANLCAADSLEGSAFAHALGVAGEVADVAAKMCIGMPFGANIQDSLEDVAANVAGLLPAPDCFSACVPLEPACFKH